MKDCKSCSFGIYKDVVDQDTNRVSKMYICIKDVSRPQAFRGPVEDCRYFKKTKLK